MTKLRKQRRRKVYKHNINRKRMRNRLESKGNIACKDVKNAWDNKKSLQSNLEEMGLSYDPNKTVKITKRKVQLQEALGHEIEAELPSKTKKYVAESLEAEAKAPREKRLRLPKSQIEWTTYLLKKYGNNYKEMAKDKKNYYQETWKQLRQKIRLFKKIPEHYQKFIEENGTPIPSDNDDARYSDDEI